MFFIKGKYYLCHDLQAEVQTCMHTHVCATCIWHAESIRICSSFLSENGSPDLLPQLWHKPTTTASILLDCVVVMSRDRLFLASLLLQTTCTLCIRVNHCALSCSTQCTVELLHNSVQLTRIKQIAAATTLDSRAPPRGEAMAEMPREGLELAPVIETACLRFDGRGVKSEES